MELELAKLYSIDSKGVKRYWLIETDDNKIITRYGQVGGEEICNEEVIEEGKNIGKSNETTPSEQAYLQAVSRWNKKVTSGYYLDNKVNECYGTDYDKSQSYTLLPMLAHDYHKRSHDIGFPCYLQPKLDGVRAMVFRDEDGEVVIISRLGKKFVHLKHIKDNLKGLFNEELYKDIVLDGELYTKELKFEEITGLCRKKTIKVKDEDKMRKIKFYLFDIYNKNKPQLSFKSRFEEYIFNTTEMIKEKYKEIVIVDTILVNKKNEIKYYYNKYMELGYEGIMFRNRRGIYKLRNRSKDLQKYKEFQDSEYLIVGFKEGVGLAKGTVIWVCEYYNTKEKCNKEFNVRPRGTKEEREMYYQNGDKYIGKKLTVRYQELSDVGCPRFPVGITFRDYE